ncbi:MAG TPA: hypothetical protein VFQ42_02150, partial [Mycobacterium sp.]|nr:hypothetical protein [Mycobacterium sp.]
LTLDQADALAKIDRQFTIMTDAGPSRWTEEAVTTGEDWQEVRRLARLALTKLNTQQSVGPGSADATV